MYSKYRGHVHSQVLSESNTRFLDGFIDRVVCMKLLFCDEQVASPILGLHKLESSI